ncbi:hypothetical protein [Nocardioides sp.]|uniref:hypothetical protein n=1 Tax=Nocardioides sp. TaxID=35761 RepID=UPI002734A39E|nr:hypothetical protein [Nocardioides sp.]MDP3894884.1 hypothetical protein [Nocardioides sp.]
MKDEDPGPMPEPEAVAPQKNPGGADAVDDSGKYGETPGGPATRDLHPDDNPAVDDDRPDELAESDEKQQEGDDSDPSKDSATDEPPA